MPNAETLYGRPGSSAKTVFIANGREFFSPIDSYVPAGHKAEFVQTDNDETDPMIFELGNDKVVFVPERIDPEYVRDMADMFDFKNVNIIRQPASGNGLSLDVLHDSDSFALIQKMIRDSGPETRVIPWGHTPQFQELHAALKRSGLSFQTPETPLEYSQWHPDYANTKLGTREILKRAQLAHPELSIRMPEGFPCPDVDTALKIAKYFVGTNRNIVMKANLGAAGIGVFVFSPEEYDLKTSEGWSAMEKKVRETPLLENGPIVIEEYIEPDFSNRAVFPSVDSMVKPDGTVEIQAVSGMGIHHDGNEVEFYGSTIGHGLFTEEQYAYIRAVNKAVGQEHAKLGYRGWFDTDFILAKDGNFYLTETNVRRTGTTYMVDLARHLFGDNWESQMAMIANDKYIRPHLMGVSHKELKEKLADILYPVSGEKRGIVLVQSMRSMLGRGKFGYAAIGRTQEDAEALEKQLEHILG